MMTGCTKVDLKPDSTKESKNTNTYGARVGNNCEVIDKVTVWLEEVSQRCDEKADVISRLRPALDFQQLRMENLNESDNIVIIPIKEEFTAAENASAQNFLIVTFDTDENIARGNIVQYISLDGSNEVVGEGVFGELYNLSISHLNGKFVFRNLADRLLYQFTYEEGNFKAATYREARDTAEAGRSVNCKAWYLVTYHYSVDEYGHLTLDNVDSDYIGTTCDHIGVDDEDVNNGGGGYNNVHEIITDEINADIEEDDQSSNPDDAAINGTGLVSTYIPIKYKHKAQKRYDAETKIVQSVTIYPTFADPLVSPFINAYPHITLTGTRSLTLFNHINTWVPLIPPRVMVTWNCLVHARYVRSDFKVWTDQWVHTRVGVD